jgi:catechol 2,3-dioxygenase-like lactoylglutathione lyase family enzyme
MLDHIFLSVSDVDRSVAFYATTLAPLGPASLRPALLRR